MKKQIIFLISMPFVMLSLSYLAVPLYKVFCSATGYGGATKRAEAYFGEIGKKDVEVSFNSDISDELHWKFYPLQKKVRVKTGERKLVFYQVENLTDKEVVGMAVYNVTPELAGKYFNKMACFCFARQVLAPHEVAVMPVSFFIDPKIESDPDIGGVSQITLSYTFFKSE